MIPRSVLRAAGVYAEEVQVNFGLLLLKAAVSSGIALRDGFNYQPDSRLIPKSNIALREELMKVWREHRAFVRELSVFLEYGHGLPANLEYLQESFEGFSDPMPLAVTATTMRPADALAQCTLAANHVRRGEPRKGMRLLSAFIDRWNDSPVPELARVYCNLAAAFDASGDKEAARNLTMKAIQRFPRDPFAKLAWQSLQSTPSNKSNMT